MRVEGVLFATTPIYPATLLPSPPLLSTVGRITHSCLLSLHRVLGPDSSRVQELGLPRLEISVQVRDQLILLVRHTRSEVSDSSAVRLLGPPQVRLRNEHEAHGQHAETSELLGRVEDGGRETRGHFTVETNLCMSYTVHAHFCARELTLTRVCTLASALTSESRSSLVWTTASR